MNSNSVYQCRHDMYCTHCTLAGRQYSCTCLCKIVHTEPEHKVFILILIKNIKFFQLPYLEGLMWIDRWIHPQSNQSAGPVRFLIFCSRSICLLASPWQVGNPSGLLVQISRECTPPYLSTGISNLLQPAQAEVVLGQRSTYLASWNPPTSYFPVFFYFWRLKRK